MSWYYSIDVNDDHGDQDNDDKDSYDSSYTGRTTFDIVCWVRPAAVRSVNSNCNFLVIIIFIIIIIIIMIMIIFMPKMTSSFDLIGDHENDSNEQMELIGELVCFTHMGKADEAKIKTS